MTQQPSEFGHLIGAVLSERYRIDTLLGEGGMGAVFVGEHLLMHKKVAIKLLRPEMSHVGEAVQRFEREAMAASHIDHPNVVSATDFGRLPDGTFFMVLEYIEGKNLREVLFRGPLVPQRAVRIAEQIASALSKAHGKGIVHRDLKPENVMLVDRDGDPDFVKVLDFGIAKVPVDALRGQEVTTGQGLTRLGVMYGTPEYMAPEQAMGTEVDHRVDLYALGIMLFEMLTGVRPFDADDVVTLVTMHIAEPPPPLTSRLPPTSVLPPGLDELVSRMLAKDRDQRPSSAREVVEALRRMHDDPFRSPAPSSVVVSSVQASSGAEPTAFAAEALAASGRGGYSPTGMLGPTPTSLGGQAPASGASPTSLPGGGPVGTLPTQLPGGGEAARTALGDETSPPVAAEPRWKRDLREAIPELERMRAQLPGPLAKIPLVVYPAAFGSLVLVGLLVLLWPRSDPATTEPTASPSASAPSSLSDSDIEEAARTGPAALEAYAEKYPNDSRVLRALVKLHHEAKRPADAVKALGRLAKLQPEVATDDLAVAVIRSAIEGPPEAADAAFALLEGGMGEGGVEFLYGLWTAKKDVSSKTQSRAGKSLAKQEVRERAPKPIRALIELKMAPASCEVRLSGVELAREAGDARAVPLLRQLQSKRGCGFASMQDCWPCLRNGNALNEAIKAAEKRPEP